jgi:hypothetical protein
VYGGETVNVDTALKRLRKPINFKNLTPNQKRVAVAKDVIAALKARKIYPVHSYGHVTLERYTTFEPNTELRSVLPKAKSCEACAIGAVFLAVVGRDDAFKIDSGYCGRETHVVSWSRDDIVQRLQCLFSHEQLDLMEKVYELDGEEIGRNASEVRMVEIMKNVIRNNGTFKPTKRQLTSGYEW